MNSQNQNQNQNSGNQGNGQNAPKRATRMTALAILILSPLGLGMIWMVSHSNSKPGSSDLSSGTGSPSSQENQLAQKVKDPDSALLPPALPLSQQAGQVSQPSQALSVGPSRDKLAPSPIVTLPQPTLPSQANSTTPKGGAVPASQNSLRATDGCFEITFKHKKISSHSDGEACLQHQNLITLQHAKLGLISALNPSSVCVEVNGEVVKHKKVAGHPDQLLIGPEAGPNATITARACIGKSQCAKKCVLKTDHFMASLGMEENADTTHKVGWNGSTQETQEDAALSKEVKEAHSLLNNTTDNDAETVFNGWIADQYADLNCGKGGIYAESKGLKISQRSSN